MQSPNIDLSIHLHCVSFRDALGPSGDRDLSVTMHEAVDTLPVPEDHDVVAILVERSGQLDTLRDIHRWHPTTPLIALIEGDDEESRRAALQAGAWQVVLADRPDRLLAAAWRCEAQRAQLRSGLSRAARTLGVIEATGDAIITIDTEGRIIEWSDAAEALFGWPAAQVMGRELADVLIPRERRDLHRRGLRGAAQGPMLRRHLEVEGLHRDGGRIPVDMTVASSVDSSGAPAFTAVLHDISERRRAMDKLRAGERLFESAAVGAAVCDAQGRVVHANPALCRFLGRTYEQVVATCVDQILHPDDRPRVLAKLEALRRGEHDRVEFQTRYLHPDQQVRMGSVSVVCLPEIGNEGPRTFALIEDITAKQHAEDRLRRAHRLRAVGRLAAGAAHEINTPLQYMSDNLSFITEAVALMGAALKEARALIPADSPARAVLHTRELDDCLAEVVPAVQEAREGVGSVSRVVKALRAFSAVPQAQWRAVDLNGVLNSTLLLTRPETQGITVRTELAADLPMVSAQEAELRQVVLGLVLNAMDALATVETPGTLRLHTETDGSWVHLEVTDDGPGIPLDVQPKLFDPFFTTRGAGGKLGIGLAQAHAVVVEQHQGRLSLVSSPGEGTTVRVSLPLR